MPDLADLFPGYESHWIDTDAGRIFVRTGGKGPPLLLLHGHPQTNVMWHRVAPALAEKYSLILPDLPGYGWSAAPKAKPDHSPYDKRSMANAIIAVMEQLGHVRWKLAGHDRGGRVGYRMALDHPGRIEKLAVLDIVPTYNMWKDLDDNLAMKIWHWTFLAQPYPLPEKMVGGAPIDYWNLKSSKQSGTKDISCFDPRALAHYHTFFNDPTRIHALCEDYRAGQTRDLEFDSADRDAGNKITIPLFALWGDKGIPSEKTPLDVWRQWATNVSGHSLSCGHYLAEEKPEETQAALLKFFA
ncbi:fluoroacetate dehalogenase [Variibacter gotjawalensis]|uniref:Fluoroacetate dehalogenase n=1 Tax=Variibacter gotjawalensis TaxID=1333996 RepID=A0A0S3PPM6_9BRAD|nr:alpha/beta hydrolase [Variibacter gotjawalensis]NIK48197.1 haloacetate dehalogenase [Variibacter gotjawalensis]RZS50068.1 haloacetate dehalogenase [Variibacter gotjawalensis]BAT57899.1 fluoroacetate dehalogenase [Variibacter gotjawalensis]